MKTLGVGVRVGKTIRYPDFRSKSPRSYSGNIHLPFLGKDTFTNAIQSAFEIFIRDRTALFFLFIVLFLFLFIYFFFSADEWQFVYTVLLRLAFDDDKESVGFLWWWAVPRSLVQIHTFIFIHFDYRTLFVC